MKIIILLSLLGGVIGQLYPSFSPEDSERDFHKYDFNNDGDWTLDELLVAFDSFDINGDLFLTLDEVVRSLPSGYPQREVQGMFKYYDKLDGTNDDRIARIGVNHFFNILDTDGNGVVSFAEYKRNIPMRKKEQVLNPAIYQPNTTNRAVRLLRTCLYINCFTPEDGERDFHKYDLNSDGFWQLRELLHVFDSFDINGDRFVTMDEVNRFLPSGYPQRELQGCPKYFVMKIIILLSLLAGVLGMLSPSISFNPKDIERDFHKFDFNKDGNWQLEEVLLSFDHIDIDGDGFLNMNDLTHFLPSEYPTSEVQGMFKYCDKLDGTNDDRIARINVNNLFKILDTDDNGNVSLAEFQRNLPQVLSGMLEEVEASMVKCSRS
ncbi:hypothetical protein C0Q70_13011 [Pomacea canaliculata]|uniref:EF-hand domain-containing protein n=2 Tax=Pomacea canaliculata TaxID=400727 RepID=A0A2T7P352_POMCA|nr:hypothetical protein C0Q70_13011 [Pomacea canaliculata]